MWDYKMKPHGKLKDTKSTHINKLHFYTLTEQSQMELKNNSIYKSSKNNT